MSLGGVPKIPQTGWFKRRLPLVGPVPMPAHPGTVVPAPPPVLVVNPGGKTRRAVVAMGRLPLKAPPPNVAGGVPVPFVRRWDFERAALVYRERPVYLFRLAQMPPPALFDLRSWYAEGRGNEWDSDARTLKWSADVSSYLTKRSGEARQYVMDFSALPELQSANLASVSSVTAQALTVGAGTVTLTNPALGTDGKSATVWIAGGVSGARYKISFTVTIAGGTVLEDFGYLLVEDE